MYQNNTSASNQGQGQCLYGTDAGFFDFLPCYRWGQQSDSYRKSALAQHWSKKPWTGSLDQYKRRSV